MPDNEEDQNIINGELPKISRHHYKKQGTNYSKRDKQELDRTELKLKLNTLTLNLLQQKAINKPLANKISKLILGKARQPTLESYYNNLQQIEYNFKSDKKSKNQKQGKMLFKISPLFNPKTSRNTSFLGCILKIIRYIIFYYLEY